MFDQVLRRAGKREWGDTAPRNVLRVGPVHNRGVWLAVPAHPPPKEALVLSHKNESTSLISAPCADLRTHKSPLRT